MTDSSNSSIEIQGEVILDSPPKAPKQVSPAKAWCFTWNNPPKDWRETLRSISSKCSGFIAGAELAPTTGTPHIQGYIEFATKKRPIGHLELPKEIQWLKAKGNRRSNEEYCSKDGAFIHYGSCEPPEPPYTIDIELRPWQLTLQAIVEEKPNDRDIHWIWEPVGGTGKTTFQKWLFLNYNNAVVLSGKCSDMKNGIVMYQKTNKRLPRTVLINIPKCNDADCVSWQGIEEIKDMFFFSGKYESGMVCGPNPHVLIFSNEPAPRFKMSEDRWTEHYIGDDCDAI